MPSSQVTEQQLRPAMQKTNDLFNTELFGRHNFDAVDEIYTVDAHILPPGAHMISGRTAIREFWSQLIVGANATSAVLESLEVIPAGDGAIEIGRATLTISPDGQSQSQMEAKYVVHWKQEHGVWKWNIDIWNTNS